MAHEQNFLMNDYDIIYEDVLPFLQNDDLTFANFEVTVCDDLPYANYPRFNVHRPYANAAIKAGFDVFSIINNHTNDNGKKGIESTFQFFTKQRSQEIYSAGIKVKPSDEISYDLIEINDWRILFCSISEIFNEYINLERLDYFPSTKKGHDKLKKAIKNVTDAHKYDLFILGIHTNEPEYVLEVSQNRKNWYYELLDCGVNIIWANHQHVSQEWEIVKSVNQDGIENEKLIMYCIGNFVSGQRRSPQYNNPNRINDYTGDSYLLQITINDKKEFSRVVPVYITTHIDIDEKTNERNFLVKHLSESFIKKIEKQNKVQGNYYKKRLELMQQIKGKTVWRIK
ncbi:MAG: CapA family protein [Treponema sp.]|nr:CapA family protein [Treponema sp.]